MPPELVFELGRRESEGGEVSFFSSFFQTISRPLAMTTTTQVSKKNNLTSERATTPAGPSGPSPAEQEEQTRKRHQREQQVSEQRRVVALRVALGHRDVDAGAREDVDEVGVVGQHDERAAAVDGRQLELRAVLREAHALDLAGVDGVDELGVAPLVALGQGGGVFQGGRGRGGKLARLGLDGGGLLLLGRGREVEGESRGRGGGGGEGRERGEARGGEELVERRFWLEGRGEKKKEVREKRERAKKKRFFLGGRGAL